MNIAKEISSFVTQEFSTQRYKDFISYIFSNGEGFEFLIEDFEEPEEKFIYIKKEYCLLPEPLNLGNFQKLQFYVFEVDSVNAKIGLYKELKKRLETIDSSAILACFYQEGNPTFRLSLITRSLDEKGNIKYSSSKRQSFVLGNYNKTALLKFNELAKNTKDPSKTLEALTQAFSVENVTKEFYNKIVESFEEFAKEIKFPIKQEDTYTRQFILRMFSRILFCKFLEKKEVIPSKIWDREYIKTTNYYHDVLEPLFFQTLNTEKDCRDYGLIDTKIQELLRDIPYLNGGLFAPQEGDFFDPKNPTAHINDLIIPNSLFDKLFETLDTFHFTIDESTPLDQEVGLDPEMLGMVFENLLSILFTDNKVDEIDSLRKKTGSYYTPREIVSYMVKNSILEYLKTNTKLNEKELAELVFDYKNSFGDEEKSSIVSKLNNFKVLDPACGSGAFPMGMLQEICLILEALNHTDNLYNQKLSILQNNIYGVDIQPMAIEIARLRCFLSLVCEENKDHISPLPNLEFKFISANSLIPMPKNDNVLIYDAYNTIKEIMDQYFTSSDKKDLQKKYKEAQQIIAKEYQFSSLVEYDPFNPQSVAGFFDGELMFRVKEFDCIIGNPPYGASLNDDEKKKYKEIYKSSSSDTAQLFIFLADKFLSKNGINTFIVPKALTFATNWKQIRDFLKPNVSYIIDCGKAWSHVLLEMIVYLKKKDMPTHSYITGFLNEERGISQMLEVPKEYVELFGFYPNDLSKEELQVGVRIRGEFPCNLGDYGKNFRGDNFQNAVLKQGDITVLGGREIQQYHIKGIKGYIENNLKLSEKSLIQKNSILMQRLIAHIQKPTPHIKMIGTIIESKKAKDFRIVDTVYQIVCNPSISNSYILGCLHSNFLNWYCYRFTFAKAIRTFQFSAETAMRIPIPQITESNQSTADKIIALVEEILKAKEQNPKADTSAQESEIDKLVYALYNLTPEEIAIIEEK